jgi:hypothetical protein
MNTHLRIRNIVMVLVGVAGLLSKSLGNVAASFAVFFLVSLAPVPKLHRVWIVVVALAIVEAFELTNGFGVMTNVYDPFDYLANSLGISLAFCADLALTSIMKTRSLSS